MNIPRNYSLELATFKYVLVDFPDDNNSLALVSTSWVFFCHDLHAYKCRWPGSVNANQFAKKHIKPSLNWEVCICGIKRFFLTYNDGNEDLKSYNSDESIVDQNKRKIFPNKRFCSSSDDQLVSKKKVKRIEDFTLPPMPLYQSTQNNIAPITETTPIHIATDNFDRSRDVSPLSPSMFPEQDCSFEANMLSSIKNNNDELEKSYKDPVADIFEQVTPIDSQVNLQSSFGIDQVVNLLNDVSGQYKTIQNTLNQIKVDIVDIQKQMEHQALILRTNSGDLDDDSLQLPFETVTDLDEFELKLKENDPNNIYENILMKYLLKVGYVKQSSKTVYNLLKRVMTNKVAEAFNITGKGSKKAFGKYKISQIIRNAVYKLQGVTELEYMNCLGLWLRQANNRGG